MEFEFAEKYAKHFIVTVFNSFAENERNLSYSLLIVIVTGWTHLGSVSRFLQWIAISIIEFVIDFVFLVEKNF